MDQYIHRDEYYDAVFAPVEPLDSMVIAILGIMCPSLVRYFKVALKEHLPGGELHDLTSDQVRGIPTHNKYVERMFGYWKMLLQYMPNVREYTAETFTLYACNNTGKYLAAKSVEERRQIIIQARKDVPTLRKNFKERRSDIQRVRRENLEKERAEKERKEKGRLAELERLVKAVEAIGGLWTSVDSVDSGLERLTTGKRGENKLKLEGIKSQIHYRKKVMSQNVPAKYGNFSQAGKSFSLAEMTQRLKDLVSFSKS